MTEDRFEELLGPYLLGALSVQEERELERHLEECHDCRQDLDRVRRSHDLLRQLATHEPPIELEDQVLAQVRSEMPTRSSGGWWLWISAAAVLLLFAVLGIGILREITGDPSTSVPLTATTVAPAAGGQVRVEEEGENLRVEL